MFSIQSAVLLGGALLLLVAAARGSRRVLAPWRRAASLAVRSTLVALLALSLAPPAVTRREDRPYLTVFVADVSESVPPDAWGRSFERLQVAWSREVDAGNPCALVAFAGRTQVLIPPARGPLPDDLARRLAHRAERARLAAASERGDPDIASRIVELDAWCDRMRTGETDLSAGIAAARALFSEPAVGRIVLVTDGLDTTRPAREIDLPPGTPVVRLDGASRRDVAVSAIQPPLAVRSGEPFDVRVTVTATSPAEITLRLAIDDVAAPGAARPYRVPAGRSVVTIESVQQSQPLAPGLHRLLVMAESAADDEPRNNAAGAAVTVTGRPRVLLVEGTPGEAEPLARMLRAQEIEFSRQPPDAARATPLEEFVAVILAGVPREALPAPFVRALRDYVEGSGGGLWVVGSAALQGPSGYAKSEIEELLPVSFLPDAGAGGGRDPGPKPAAPGRSEPSGPAKRVLAPTVAMLFIVDKSGSMAGNNIRLVREACIESAKTLSPRDVVGVLAFDARPFWVLEFVEATRRDYIEDRVLKLYADGGTHIQPALVEALHAFRTNPLARAAGVKHAVLLSDGDTQPADIETVVKQMAAEGITVSSVCVAAAPKFDPLLMSQVAAFGRGRFLFASSFQAVPQIFMNETRKVVSDVPRPEEPPAPAQPPDPPPKETGTGATAPLVVVSREDHEVLQGVERKSIPALRGKLGAAARPSIEIPLATEDGQPVLALWRRGLGRVAVWTSDLSGRWTADWIVWPSTSRLFAQLVRHLSSAAPDDELAARTRISVEGGRAQVRLDPGPADEALAASHAVTRVPFPLARDAEGGWRVTLPPDRPGGMTPVLLQGRDGKKFLVGAVRGGDPEFAAAEPERDLFAGGGRAATWEELDRSLGAARMSAERRVDLAPWLIVAALLLLPLDVALRRFNA